MERAATSMTLAIMNAQPATTTLRETVDELGRRLARIGAAASSLENVAADIRSSLPPGDLLPLFQQIERDLKLAERQLDVARERAKVDVASFGRS